MWTVSASALASIGAGVTAGLILAFASNRIVERWVPGNTFDPAVPAVAIVLLGVVGALACAIPARHASGIDPASALRFE
jgi:ABC-type antimicrobial peptide transport system permease subunit